MFCCLRPRGPPTTDVPSTSSNVVSSKSYVKQESWLFGRGKSGQLITAAYPAEGSDATFTDVQKLNALFKDFGHATGSQYEQLTCMVALIAERFSLPLVSVSVLSLTGETYTNLAASGDCSRTVSLGLPHALNHDFDMDDGAVGVERVLHSKANVAVVLPGSSKSRLSMEWSKLHLKHNISGFLAVPIMRGEQLLGVLTVADKKHIRLTKDSCVSQLEVIATWLGNLLHDGWLGCICNMLEEVDKGPSIDSLVKATAMGLINLSHRKMYLKLNCRVALIHSEALTTIVFEEVIAPAVGGVLGNPDGEDGFAGRRRAHVPSTQPDALAALHDSLMSEGGRRPEREQTRLSSPMASRRNSVLSVGYMSVASSFTSVDYSLQVLGHTISLDRTILGQALKSGHGRIINDCTEFMNEADNPTHDIYVSSKSANAVAMVVAALADTDATPLMGIYLTSPTFLPAAILKSVLRDLEEVLVLMRPVVHSKLVDDLNEEYEYLQGHVLDPVLGVVQVAMQQQHKERKSTSSELRHEHGGTGSGMSTTSPPHTHNPPNQPHTSGDTDSSRLHAVRRKSKLGLTGQRRAPVRHPSFNLAPSEGSSPHKVGPLLMGLQDKLRTIQISSMQHQMLSKRPSDVKDLVIMDMIGKGGFGTVYYGHFHGLQVAIKLIHERGGDVEMMRDALELAIMSTLSHPNILQVLTYFTDVLAVYPRRLPYEPRMPGNQVVLMPADDPEANADDGKRAIVICTEYCDMGSLDDAIRNGEFMKTMSGEAGPASVNSSETRRPDKRMVYATLLEIALALRHLHGLQLVHCDLKPSNVLLKSCHTDSRGFNTKLTDFGLTKLVAHFEDPEDTSDRNSPDAPATRKPRKHSGTVTHMAPEMLTPGSQITFAVDIFAFGITMWELYTGEPLYKGMTPDKIRADVAAGVRPEFPGWVPENFSHMAKRCWSEDISDRPDSEELVSVMKAMVGTLGTSGSSRRGSRRCVTQNSLLGPMQPQAPGRATMAEWAGFPLHIL